jgi:O-acetylserine/cysteine efflux transporter
MLLATLVAAIWGFNFVIIEVGLDNFPPLLFAALRFAAAAFPTVLFVRRPNVPWRWFVTIGLPQLLATALVVGGVAIVSLRRRICTPTAVSPELQPAATR